MSHTPRDAVIQEYVKMLKMPAIGRDYPAVSQQARDGGWAYEDYLKELLERAMHSRHAVSGRMRLRPQCAAHSITSMRWRWCSTPNHGWPSSTSGPMPRPAPKR